MFPSNIEGERLNDVAIMENEYDFGLQRPIMRVNDWRNRPGPVPVGLLMEGTVY